MYNLMVNNNLKSFTSFDKIEKTLGVTLDEFDKEKLVKAARKGDVLHAARNPYDSEMSSGETNPSIGILLKDTAEELHESFWSLKDSI